MTAMIQSLGSSAPWKDELNWSAMAPFEKHGLLAIILSTVAVRGSDFVLDCRCLDSSTSHAMRRRNLLLVPRYSNWLELRVTICS